MPRLKTKDPNSRQNSEENEKGTLKRRQRGCPQKDRKEKRVSETTGRSLSKEKNG